MNFLHIGYPKCGSTFLQTRYFSKDNQFFNLLQIPEWKLFIENQLLSAQSSYYLSTPPNLPVSNIDKSWMVGLSTENFLDGIHLVDLQISLKRWKTIFPETKVLIIIRKQEELVYSNYIQYLRAGYFRNVDIYLKEIIWNSQQSIWGRLYYDRIYETTRNIFDEVLVIPYELISSFDQFITKLNTFFEVSAYTVDTKIRVSSSDLAQQAIRLMNYLVRFGYGKSYHSIVADGVVGSDRHKFNALDGIDPSKKFSSRLRHKLINRIDRFATADFQYRQRFIQKYAGLFEDRFAESNQQLEKNLQLNLREHGYTGF